MAGAASIAPPTMNFAEILARKPPSWHAMMDKTLYVTPEENPDSQETYGNLGLRRLAKFNVMEVDFVTEKKFVECMGSETPISWSPYSLIRVIQDEHGAPLETPEPMGLRDIVWRGDDETHREFNDIIKAIFLRYALNTSVLKDNKFRFWQQEDKDGAGRVIKHATFIHLLQEPPRAMQPSTNDFKIHMSPKPEYAFWLVVRLLKYTVDNFADAFAPKAWKFFLNPRMIDIDEKDTLLIEANGYGSLPAIVIYGKPDPVANYYMLRNLVSFTTPFSESIGNITRRIKLPPGNLRFNALIAYASGDRSQKLEMLRALKSGAIKAIPEKYGASEWVEKACREGKHAVIDRYFMDDTYCWAVDGKPPKKDWFEVRAYPLPDPETLMVEHKWRRMIPRGLRAAVRTRLPGLSAAIFGARDPERIAANLGNTRRATAAAASAKKAAGGRRRRKTRKADRRR